MSNKANSYVNICSLIDMFAEMRPIYEFGIVPNSFCERRRDMQVTEAMNHGGHINQTGTYLEFPPITSRHHIRRGVTISLPGKYGNETMTSSTLSLSQVTLRTRDTGYKSRYANKSCLLSLRNQQHYISNIYETANVTTCFLSTL